MRIECPLFADVFAYWDMKPLLAVLLLCLPSPAASIVTGGQLLNQTNANQLAAWLGQGDLQLTNVFSSALVNGGGTAFHTAVDGVGPTFILVQTNLGLIGGYDPLSWSSIPGGSYNINPTDAGRTAFIFNLSNFNIMRQRLANAGGGYGDTGYYQTYDYNLYGPTFGGGHDLYVDSNLAGGYNNSFSFGNGYLQPNLFGLTGQTIFTITRVEAFTFNSITATATPEPATFALFGGALALLGMLRRRT